MKRQLRTLLVIACLTPSLASAQLITFNLSYSGLRLGNNATAFGQVVFDSSVLPVGPVNLSNVSAATLGVVGWSLTVSGAGTGNGSFTLSDLELVAAQRNGWLWNLVAPINLSTELVGQANFADFNWCGATNSCGNALAPGGSSQFTIRTAGETGDQLVLTSMVASIVPEPSTMALMLVGVAAVGAAAARRGRNMA